MIRRSHAQVSLYLAVSLTLAFAGCVPPPGPTDPAGNGGTASGTGRLKAFASADDLLRYFREQVSQGLNNGGDLRGGAVAENFAGAPGAATPTVGQLDDAGVATNGESGGVEFTSTNVQEAGVDEGDFVKTDGRYLYVARGSTLRILDTKTADAAADDLRPISEIDLLRPISAIYLSGDSVIAIAQDFGYGWATPALAFPEIAIWPPYYTQAALKIFQISVSDKAAPAVIAESEFDGSLVSSRLTGGRLLLVLTISPNLPPNLNQTGAARLTLDDVLPQFRHDGQSEVLVDWQGWLRPDDPNGYNMTAVVTLDAANIETKLNSVAVLANSYTIYASTSALYVTDTTYEERDNIANEITTVHKFALTDSGAVYSASGSITGRPLNQFSLGEFNGDLRIATQVQPFEIFRSDDVVGIGILPGIFGGASGGGTSGSSGVSAGVIEPAPARAQGITADVGPSTAVYVLRQNGESLDTIGKIENIKPGERMYAARFMGPRGFLVTFRQIDPLFVLDLTDPGSPRIAGELQVPGFSEYLHLLDQDHLIGIGTSTVQAPWGATIPSGIQVSLFDVSDSANPTSVQQLTIGESWSKADASFDHRAFALFQHQGANILALPALVVDTDDNQRFEPIDQFNGVLTFTVNAQTGFADRGRLSAVVERGYWGGWNEWRRVVIISGRLFAISSAGIQAGNLADLAATNRVEFPPLQQDVPQGWTELPRPVDGFIGPPARGL